MALHTIRVQRPRPIVAVAPSPLEAPPERFVDAFHIRTRARAAALTPPRSPVPTAFKPPPRDLTADLSRRQAEDDLAAALLNLRNLPDPIGPFTPETCPWPAINQHRNLLVQAARNARRRIQGYTVGQDEADLSPAALERAARLKAAELAARQHSGRSPQHGRI